MVNTSADNVDTITDSQPIVLHAQGKEMHHHNPQPQTLDPWPPRRMPETNPFSGREFVELVMSLKHCPAIATLRDAESAENTSAVDVDQHLLGRSAGGDSFANVDLPNVPVPEPHHDESVREE